MAVEVKVHNPKPTFDLLGLSEDDFDLVFAFLGSLTNSRIADGLYRRMYDIRRGKSAIVAKDTINFDEYFTHNRSL